MSSELDSDQTDKSPAPNPDAAVRGSNNLVYAMFLVGALCALGACLYLAKVNAQLTTAAQSVEASHRLRRGDYIPLIPLTPLFPDKDAAALQISSAPATLLYVYSTTCEFCQKQLPTLPAILGKAKDLGYNVVALSTGKKIQLVSAYPSEPPYTIAYSNGVDVLRNTRVEGTPSFLLVNSSGEVLEVHEGVLTPQAFEQEFSPELVFHRHSGKSSSLPTPLYIAMPHLTAEAKAHHYTGDVIATFIVDETGHPQAIHLNKQLDYGLDQRAIAAVQTARFSPATRDDKPIATQLHLIIHFSNVVN